jgi:hypothetical protein
MPPQLILSRNDAQLGNGMDDYIDWRDNNGVVGSFMNFNGDICTLATSSGHETEITPHIDLRRRREAKSGRWNWNGNFNANDALICTEGNDGTNAHRLGISLNWLACCAGAHIQSDYPDKGSREFVACIAAKDNNNQKIAEYWVPWLSDSVFGNAVFLGVATDTPIIRRIEMWATLKNGEAVDFAINRFAICYG